MPNLPMQKTRDTKQVKQTRGHMNHEMSWECMLIPAPPFLAGVLDSEALHMLDRGHRNGLRLQAGLGRGLQPTRQAVCLRNIAREVQLSTGEIFSLSPYPTHTRCPHNLSVSCTVTVLFNTIWETTFTSLQAAFTFGVQVGNHLLLLP